MTAIIDSSLFIATMAASFLVGVTGFQHLPLSTDPLINPLSSRKISQSISFSATHPNFLRPLTSTTHADDVLIETAADSKLGAWIPLGSASCLNGLTPTQIQVCGLDLVVWQHKNQDAKSKKGDDAGTFSAFMDACPHRLAPLSQGRVDPNTGCLGNDICSSLSYSCSVYSNQDT